MGQPAKIDRPVEKSISLPTTLVAEVDLMLYSEVEGRVPFGAWAKYMTALIRADLEKRKRGN